MVGFQWVDGLQGQLFLAGHGTSHYHAVIHGVDHVHLVGHEEGLYQEVVP